MNLDPLDDFFREDNKDNILLQTSYFNILDKMENISSIPDKELMELYDSLSDAEVFFDNQQATVKVLSNSVYGALGTDHFLGFHVNCAWSITATGKYVMFEVVDKPINKYYKGDWLEDYDLHEILFEKFGRERFSDYPWNPPPIDICVYGDTDSRYVDYYEIMMDGCGFEPKNPQEVIDFILITDKERNSPLFKKMADKIFNIHNAENNFIMELETISGKGLFLGKKKYILSLYYKDGKSIYKDLKLKPVGVELVQGKMNITIKDLMKKSIHYIMKPNFSQNELFKLVLIIMKQMESIPLNEICIMQNINKYSEYVIDEEKYILGKQTPVTVRASLNYNLWLKEKNLGDKFPRIEDGGRILMYYMKNEVPFAIPDGEEDQLIDIVPKVDLKIQAEKLFMTPLRRFLGVSNIDEISVESFGSDRMQGTFKKLTNKTKTRKLFR